MNGESRLEMEGGAVARKRLIGLTRRHSEDGNIFEQSDDGKRWKTRLNQWPTNLSVYYESRGLVSMTMHVERKFLLMNDVRAQIQLFTIPSTSFSTARYRFVNF